MLPSRLDLWVPLRSNSVGNDGGAQDIGAVKAYVCKGTEEDVKRQDGPLIGRFLCRNPFFNAIGISQFEHGSKLFQVKWTCGGGEHKDASEAFSFHWCYFGICALLH